MTQTKRLTRGQAIKKYCKESCCAGSVVDWRECPAYDCFLWRFRLGKEALGNTKSFKKGVVLPLKFTKNNASNGGQEILE